MINIYIYSNKCAQKRTIAIDGRGYIPGQLDGLHGIVSLETPTHSEPPYFGSSQTRVRYIKPRPHDFEQSDQFDQFNQNPSTEMKCKYENHMYKYTSYKRDIQIINGKEEEEVGYLLTGAWKCVTVFCLTPISSTILSSKVWALA